MKLISNTSFGEFCKSKEKEFPTRNVYLAWYEEIRNNYDNFLKQHLNLGMFAPCDEDGNVLIEPDHSMYFTATTIGEDKYYNDVYDYNQAKDKVLFENTPISQAKWLVNSFSTIESLSDISNIITPIYLNNNAIKQI